MEVKFLEINQEQSWVKFTVDVNGKPYTKRMMVKFEALVTDHVNPETGEIAQQILPVHDHILLQIKSWHDDYVRDLKQQEVNIFNKSELLNKKVTIDSDKILNSLEK